MSILLGIKKFKYASRSDYIQVKNKEKKLEMVNIDSLKINKQEVWF